MLQGSPIKHRTVISLKTSYCLLMHKNCKKTSTVCHYLALNTFSVFITKHIRFLVHLVVNYLATFNILTLTTAEAAAAEHQTKN